MQSLEDVIDCLSGLTPAVWFTSTDESAAREYIYYCSEWLRSLHELHPGALPPLPFSPKGKTRSREIHFSNNTRIHALSSNPSAFRSKGGKVTIDEFAHHKNDALLWKAAVPCITWGAPLRILSTHNSKNSLFYKFVEDTAKGKLPWQLHRTDIYSAVSEGIVDTILGRAASADEREKWIAELRSYCTTDEVWHEEYCCVPSDEKTAFIHFALMEPCYGPPAELSPLDSLYAGIDLARSGDLTVIWRLVSRNNILYTVDLTCMRNELYSRQLEIILPLLRVPALRRVCVDAAGLGGMMSELIEKEFGRARVEKVTPSSKINEELAYAVRRRFEDRTIIIPSSPEIAEDIHSVKKITTSAKNIRYDAKRNENGHADRFWALALAIHAAENAPQTGGKILTSGRTIRGKLLEGFK